MDFSRCCAIVGSVSFDAAHFSAEREQGRFACVVAADGGFANLQRIGVTPDAALGDFDSLGYEPAADRMLVERHPVMKDASDLELAFEWALANGYTSAVVYGALGGRLDHTMATQQVLVQFARRGMTVAAVGEGFLVAALSTASHKEPSCASLDIAADAAGTFSVFAMGGDACGMTERGVLYEIEDVTLPCDTSLGLSNEFVGSPAHIEVCSGDVLVFLPAMPLKALA